MNMSNKIVKELSSRSKYLRAGLSRLHEQTRSDRDSKILPKAAPSLSVGHKSIFLQNHRHFFPTVKLPTWLPTLCANVTAPHCELRTSLVEKLSGSFIFDLVVSDDYRALFRSLVDRQAVPFSLWLWLELWWEAPANGVASTMNRSLNREIEEIKPSFFS